MLRSHAGSLGLVLSLCVLCVTETLCFTYFKKLSLFADSNNLLYLICGIMIVLLAVYASFCSKPDDDADKGNVWLLPQLLLAVALLTFLAILYYDYGMRTYPSWVLSYKDADMLPLIKKACERFTAGKDVYANPISEPGLWTNCYIPYLPAMWGPFVPAHVSGLDIRWTLLAVSFLGYVALMFSILKLSFKKSVIAIPVFFTLFFILTKFFTWEDKQYFLSLSQEAVPAFIYLLLFIALMLNRQWFIAVMLVLCTLSRYSIVLFIPVYFLWLLIDKDYKGFVQTGIIYTSLILALFIFPFFIQRPAYFLNLTSAYMLHDQAFWSTHIEAEKSAANLGMVYFIGYDIAVLQMLKPVMLALMAIFSVAWLFLYYKFRNKLSINKEIWLLAGFKLSLILFYNFISMPYQYLFIVPTIVSYPLLLAVINKTNFKAVKQT